MMEASSKAQRLHYLDAARATMLLLGIPFHASEIYRISGGFGIDSPTDSFVATLISGLIHSFRMPAFYLLSGFFAAMMLARRGNALWLKGRVIKLGLPLLATTLTLGVLEHALTNHFNTTLSPMAAFGESLYSPLHEWINHRWFLIVLLLYCISLVSARPLLKFVPHVDLWISRSKARTWFSGAALLGILLLTPFIAIVAGKVGGEWIVESVSGKQYANSYLKYLPFFFTGVACYAARDGLLRFTQLSRLDFIAGVPLITAYLVTYFAFYDLAYAAPNLALSNIFGLSRIALEVIVGFYASKLFFGTMRKLITSELPLISYFVDASFCIYLVHELFLITVGGLLLRTEFLPVIEIALICIGTLIGSLAVFELARRSKALAYALNGGPFAPRKRAVIKSTGASCHGSDPGPATLRLSHSLEAAADTNLH